MADNVTLPGNGAVIATDEAADGTLGTVQFQLIKLVDATLGSTNKAVVSSGGALKVDNSAVTQPVSGTFWQSTQPVSAASLPLPSGAATAAKQPALGTAGTASSDVISIQGIASMTAVKVDGSAVTQPVSGTFWQTTQPVSGTVSATLTSTTNAGATAKTSDYDTGGGTDTLTMFGVALPASGGAVAGGTSTNPLRTDPTGTTTQPVSGTVTANAGAGTMAVSASSLPLPTGAATSAKQPALGTAGSASADVITVQGVTSMTALKVDGSGVTQPVSGTFWQATQPVSGTVTANAGTGTFATSDGNAASIASTTSGQKGFLNLGAVTTAAPTYTTAQSNPLSLTTAGALRTDASGTTQPVSGTVSANATQTGTWTVQPGNTPNSTAWLVQTVPGTANGWSVSSQTALTNTKTSVKASAGLLGGYMFYNANAAVAYIQVWDVASASVTVGTTAPTYVIPIPGASGANLEIRNGITHATAIVIAATTTPTGSTAPATALVGFILNK